MTVAITIRQIARAAGVSRGTVDRALNGRSGIKPEKLEQVLKVAADLGYKPNLAAKMLSDKQHSVKKIGIALVTEHNPFYDDVLRGITTPPLSPNTRTSAREPHPPADYGDIKKQADRWTTWRAGGSAESS